jgi:hypothetical protein
VLHVDFARTKEAFVKAKGQGRAKIAAEWDDYERSIARK